MKLAPHFTLAELTASETAARNGWDNTPTDDEIKNLTRTAQLLEMVRDTVGKPVIVTSGFRSKQVNDAVGSSDRSQHRIGCASDFRVPGMTPAEVVRACVDANLPYDQIIVEFDAWTHISVPNDPAGVPRRQALIIDRSGARPFA